MKLTDAKLKELYELLMSGKTIQGIRSDGYGIGTISYGNGFFHWQHAGSSANEATLDGLRFICEKIFVDSIDFCTAHWSDYHIGYVPDDERYKGFDYSTKHPNVCGL